jgi:hypothetical protein
MTSSKTLLAVPAAVAALAFVAPSPALAITGYAGAPTAVAAQYPATGNSQSPPTQGPTTESPSLAPTPGTPGTGNSETPGTPGTGNSETPGSTPGTEDVSQNTSPGQPHRQLVVSSSPAGSLPFTGYSAIAAIAAGLALLLGGLAARRVSRV